MSSYKWDTAMLDADFAIKLGRFNKYQVIETILPMYVGMTLIHEYVYEHEVLNPKDSRDQIDRLVSLGRATIVNEQDVQKLGTLGIKVYEDTIQNLRKQKQTSENGKHWGEIVSIAYAHTMSIPYFLSDESDQQSFIDENLSSPIEVIRIENFVEAMKEAGAKRKDAKKIWIVSGKAPERFDHDLWPV